MILFEPGPPTPLLHRRHPIVKALDRAIRGAQFGMLYGSAASTVAVMQAQHARQLLVGKPLGKYERHGRRARQRRLGL